MKMIINPRLHPFEVPYKHGTHSILFAYIHIHSIIRNDANKVRNKKILISSHFGLPKI